MGSDERQVVHLDRPIMDSSSWFLPGFVMDPFLTLAVSVCVYVSMILLVARSTSHLLGGASISKLGAGNPAGVGMDE